MRKTKLLLPVLLLLLCSALLLAGFSATAMTANEAQDTTVWEEYAVGAYDAAPTVTTSDATTDIDLSGYCVVTSGGTYMQAYAQKLADRLSAITGDTVKVGTSGKRNIYIGQSNTLCQQALKNAGLQNTKCGFTVSLVGKNIAIAGTNNFLALEALDYFIATYLTGENVDATITMANSYVVKYDDADVVTVLQPADKTVANDVTTYGTNGSTIFGSVIYDKTLDHDPTYNNDSDPETEYSKINTATLKDTSATGYSLDTSPGSFAYVIDTSRDNSSYAAGVITYEEGTNRVLVNGSYLTVPESYFDGFRGQTFSITSDGYVQIRNRGIWSSDYLTITLQGLGGGVGTGNDYVYDRANLVASTIAKLTNSSCALKDDSNAATANEILVGKVAGRTEDDSVCNTLAPYEYAIAMVNGKLVLTGHSIETQQYAAYAFYDIMSNGLLGTESSGTTTYKGVYLPNNYKAVGTSLTNWGANSTTNKQKPTDRIENALLPNLTFTDVADANDGSVVVVYRSGATLEAYNTYCAQLVAGGYTLLAENSLKGSYFKTFVNYENGITLVASYYAFEGKGDYTVGQQWGTNLTEKYFAYSDPQIRVSVAHVSSVDLPTGEILKSEQTYVKLTDSAITAIDMGVAYNPAKDDKGEVIGYVNNYGTGFIIMLEDGRFIVIDGGQNGGGMQNGYDPWAQVDTIYNILADLYKKAHGVIPTNENPITIAAWILTHSHGDHINAFWDFSHKYGAGDLKCSTTGCYCGEGAYNNSVKVQYLLANAPARSIRYNAAEANEDITTNMETWQRYMGGFTYVKVHTGQIYYFANLTIEVLATVEDLYPQRVVTHNDTSNIMRLTFRSTTATKGIEVTLDNADTNDGITKTSLMSTGDIYIHTSRFITSMFGNALKADMVSMGHHGGPGAESSFYDMVAAETIWWSMNISSVCNSYATKSSWYHRIDQYVAWGSSYTKYVLVADAPTGNSTVKAGNLTVYLTANGPKYNELYNAGDVNLDGVVDSTDAANSTISYYTSALPTFNGKNQTMTGMSTFDDAEFVAYKRP